MFREIKRSNDIWTTCIVTLGSKNWLVNLDYKSCCLLNIQCSRVSSVYSLSFKMFRSRHQEREIVSTWLLCAVLTAVERSYVTFHPCIFFSRERHECHLYMSVISTCLKYSLNSEVQMLKRCENEYICRVSGKQTRRSYTDYGAYKRYSTAKNSANIIWILISNIIQISFIWKNADPGWEHYVRTRCKYK